MKKSPSASEKEPLVSIVTPSFNQAKYLEQTIQSVLQQDYPQIEHIVIDGGSTDGSRAILEKYHHHLAYWVSEPDQGQTQAINKGFARASGQILAWLNSDDTYEPRAVSRAVACLMANPKAGMVYGHGHFINQHGKKIGEFPSAQTSYDQLRRGYVHVCQQAAFWRKALWEQVGPLDESIYFAMDYDLWLRLAKVSSLQYVPEHWANFRLHEAAKTIHADNRCWDDMLKIHLRDGGSRVSVLYGKYLARKIAAPWLLRKRRRLIHGH